MKLFCNWRLLLLLMSILSLQSMAYTRQVHTPMDALRQASTMLQAKKSMNKCLEGVQPRVCDDSFFKNRTVFGCATIDDHNELRINCLRACEKKFAYPICKMTPWSVLPIDSETFIVACYL